MKGRWVQVSVMVMGAAVAAAAVASVVGAAAPGVEGGAVSAGIPDLLNRQAAALSAVGDACSLGVPSCTGTNQTCEYINTVEAERGFPTPICVRQLTVGEPCSPRRIEMCVASTCRGGVCVAMDENNPLQGGRPSIGDECFRPGDCAVGQCTTVAYSGIKSVCARADVPEGGICHSVAACAPGAGCVADPGSPVDPVLGPTGTCTGPMGRPCRWVNFRHVECALGTTCVDGPPDISGWSCVWQGRPAGGACQAGVPGACADGLSCVQARRDAFGSGGTAVCRPQMPVGSTPTPLSTPSPSPPAITDGNLCKSDGDCTAPAYCREPVGTAAMLAKRCRRYVPPGGRCAGADHVCWDNYTCEVAPVRTGGGGDVVDALCVKRRWAAPGADCVGPGIVGCWDGYECVEQGSSGETRRHVCARRSNGEY
ncbi:hypothetical protein MMPV_007132 [Pyropia vietnamensis]